MNTVTVTTPNTATLRAAVRQSLTHFTSAGKVVNDLKALYLESTPVTDAPDYWRPFVEFVAAEACQWFDEVRAHMVEQAGDDVPAKWTDFADFPAVQSGFTSFRQAIAKGTHGYGFKVTGRATPAQFADGTASTGFEITEPKARDAKQETAKGKEKGGIKAEGAELVQPDTGADVMGQLIGDAEQARRTLAAILEAHPELTLRKGVQREFQAAMEKATVRAAAKKVA